MTHFKRRLSDAALARLRGLAADDSWMHDLLAEWAPSGTPAGSGRSLRLAVRNGYLNFYRLGQSVAKVECGQGRRPPPLTLHQKYVRPCAKGQGYLRVDPHKGLDDRGCPCDWGGREMLRAWIRNSECHANCEKRRIDALLSVSPKVIDLEMALPAWPGRSDGKRSAPRMDIVALERTPGGAGARIVFWEAKMIRDSRLRAVETPKVFTQLNAYEEYVSDPDNRDHVKTAYIETCRILGRLHAIASDIRQVPPLDSLVCSATEPDFQVEVDIKPRLLIFDDGPGPDGNWAHHLGKLTNKFVDRVHLAPAHAPQGPIESTPPSPA